MSKTGQGFISELRALESERKMFLESYEELVSDLSKLKALDNANQIIIDSIDKLEYLIFRKEQDIEGNRRRIEKKKQSQEKSKQVIENLSTEYGEDIAKIVDKLQLPY